MNFNLLAADWWNWLIPAVFIIIYLLNHLLSGAKAAGAAKPPQPQRRRVPAPQPEHAARPQQPAPGQAQLNAEIEQFLKRANERRMEKARREAAPPSARPAATPPPRLAEPATDATPPDRDFNAVEKSVKQHLGNRGFQERAEHLADDILRQEAEMQRHLEQAFSHQVGTLGGGESTTPKAAAQAPPATADRAATAKALAGILANQADIRQAILLKELLERPTDRW
jgi:hypothetical protein